jgi:peptidoglycan/LPS O-acetylase OafA/YrhL
VVIVCVVLVVLVCAATLVGVLRRASIKARAKAVDAAIVEHLLNEAEQEKAQEDAGKPAPPSEDVGAGAGLFEKAFGLHEGLKSLVHQAKPLRTDSLNGIRVMSMLWIILGHTLSFEGGTGYTNPLYVYTAVINRFSFQFIKSAFYAVDNFFFLSGFLGCHLMIKGLAKRDLPLRGIPLIYLARYLRILPAVAFAVGFSYLVVPALGHGPFWSRIRNGSLISSCGKNWWATLLFVQNFAPKEFQSICMGHTWYLANDWMFSLVLPFLVLLWKKVSPRAGYALVVALYFASIVTTMGILATQPGTRAVLGGPYFNEIYSKPYTRITPFLVGVGLGFVMETHGHIKLAKGLRWAVNGLALGLSLVLLFVEYDNKTGTKWSKGQVIFYYGIHRALWSLSLAWLVYYHALGYGGVVKRFLASPRWLPLARLTFAAYIIHPVLQTAVYMSEQRFLVYTDIQTVIFYCSFVLLSWTMALVLYLLVERPFSVLSAHFLKA